MINPVENKALREFLKILQEIPQEATDHKNVSKFSNALTQLDEKTIYGLITFSDDACVVSLNIAALLITLNQPTFLQLLLEKVPSLLWQTVPPDLIEQVGVLVTPLVIAAQKANPQLLKELLRYPQLRHYAKTHPQEYAQIIDNCSALCDNSFIVPRSDKQEQVLKILHHAALHTLFSDVSQKVFAEVYLSAHRSAFPLQPYPGAPDFTNHLDLRMILKPGELFARGNDIEHIAKLCKNVAKRVCAFLKNPEHCPVDQIDRIVRRIPQFLFLKNQLIRLGATHFSANIESTQDAQTTVMTLRFVRLYALVGPFCA